MTDNPILKHGKARLRWIRLVFLIGILVAVSMSGTFNVAAQSSDGGLGVASGQGTEVGINLTAFNAIKADAARGVYDRPCTAAEHDTTRWHTLVNVQAKCHYDHTHGDDPNYVNDIFGVPGTWFGNPGQSISYPWQTFKAATALEPNTNYVANKQMENDLKHEGYIWLVRRNQSCPPRTDTHGCVTDFRLETHAIFGAHDMPVRYHSYSFEGRVCQNPNNASTCGLIKLGGWIDMGILFTTPPGVIDCSHAVTEVRIPLPADTLYRPIDRPESRDEIRCHPNITQLPAYPSNRALSEWWGLAKIRFQLRSYDPIGNVDASDPAHWQYFCGQNDLNCHYDASLFSVFIGYILKVYTGFDIKNNYIDLDPNGNNNTDNYSAFTNRWGGIDPACRSIGLDCIPMVYTNVPLNNPYKEGNFVHTVCENCARVDWDLSPSGQRWITWFYRYASPGHNQTPTPVPPTATPVTPTPITPTPVTPTPVTPTPETPTPVPTTPTASVDLNKTSGSPGESIEVSIKLFNVNGLYGLQTQCTVDPTVLNGTTVSSGDAFINETNSFFVDNHFQADGSWMVAATLKQPAAPISGTTVAYKLGYNILGTNASPVNCTVLAVDADGKEIHLDVVNGAYNGGGTNQPPATPVPTDPPTEVPTEPPTAEPPTLTPVPPTPQEPVETLPPTAASTISGTFKYQNHPDNAGITVKLSGNGVEIPLTTNANGAYQFTDVPAGEYIIEASAPNHLKVAKAISVPDSSQVIDLGTVTLPAGDTDNNGTVDVSDASLVGGNFGISAPPAPAAADLNLDSKVNISDLALVGGNYGKTGPIPAP
jgi:hypothetical protein